MANGMRLSYKNHYITNITSTNIALKRKFGGKEYQDELGLDWYDITARNYSLSPTQLGNPALGRWMNVDPGRALKKCPVDIFSEGASLSRGQMMRRHSTYNYAFNNPIFFIDPDGLAPTGATGAYGESLENVSATRILGAMDSVTTISDGNGNSVTVNHVGKEVNKVTFNNDTDPPTTVTPSVGFKFDGKKFVLTFSLKLVHNFNLSSEIDGNATLELTHNQSFNRKGVTSVKTGLNLTNNADDITFKGNLESSVSFSDLKFTIKPFVLKVFLENKLSGPFDNNVTTRFGIGFDSSKRSSIFGQFNLSNIPGKNPSAGRNVNLDGSFIFNSNTFNFNTKGEHSGKYNFKKFLLYQ